MAVKGFNTDLQIREILYHIQTEEWGEENPQIVTRIFCNGAVIKSVKTPYDLKTYKRNYLDYSKPLQDQMKNQHYSLIQRLQDGFKEEAQGKP